MAFHSRTQKARGFFLSLVFCASGAECPARPPIWLISAVLMLRNCRPSNFSVSAKTTRLMGREMPRPMASVATTMLVSPEVYFRTSLRRASGGRAAGGPDVCGAGLRRLPGGVGTRGRVITECDAMRKAIVENAPLSAVSLFLFSVETEYSKANIKKSRLPFTM